MAISLSPLYKWWFYWKYWEWKLMRRVSHVKTGDDDDEKRYQWETAMHWWEAFLMPRLTRLTAILCLKDLEKGRWSIYLCIQCNSNYFTLYKMSFLRKNMSYKMFENHCCRNSIVTWLWRHLFVRVVLSRVKFMFSCPVIFLSQQTQLWLLYWQNGAQLYFQSICAAEYE